MRYKYILPQIKKIPDLSQNSAHGGPFSARNPVAPKYPNPAIPVMPVSAPTGAFPLLFEPMKTYKGYPQRNGEGSSIVKVEYEDCRAATTYRRCQA